MFVQVKQFLSFQHVLELVLFITIKLNLVPVRLRISISRLFPSVEVFIISFCFTLLLCFCLRCLTLLFPSLSVCLHPHFTPLVFARLVGAFFFCLIPLSVPYSGANISCSKKLNRVILGLGFYIHSRPIHHRSSFPIPASKATKCP